MTLCHCVFSFHSSFSSFHDFWVATLNFHDGSAVGQCFGFGVLANKADERELVEVHSVFLLSARLLGHNEARAAAPHPSDCILWGTARISPRSNE